MTSSASERPHADRSVLTSVLTLWTSNFGLQSGGEPPHESERRIGETLRIKGARILVFIHCSAFSFSSSALCSLRSLAYPRNKNKYPKSVLSEAHIARAHCRGTPLGHISSAHRLGTSPEHIVSPALRTSCGCTGPPPNSVS